MLEAFAGVRPASELSDLPAREWAWVQMPGEQVNAASLGGMGEFLDDLPADVDALEVRFVEASASGEREAWLPRWVRAGALTAGPRSARRIGGLEGTRAGGGSVAANLGHQAEQQGAWAEAYAWWRIAADEPSAHAQIRAALCVSRVAPRAEECRERNLRALGLDPGASEAMLRLGAWFWANGDLGRAIAWLDLAEASSPAADVPVPVGFKSWLLPCVRAEWLEVVAPADAARHAATAIARGAPEVRLHTLRRIAGEETP